MPSDALVGTSVRDDTGIEYVLGAVIGKPGAQGVVYRVTGHPNLAIKLLTRSSELNRLEAVRRLPLEGLQLAAPLSLIRFGGSGYLMPLASDMTPLAEPYLPREFGSRETSSINWYQNTGGLRRRLAIAANVAQCLAGLHERGLAYVDLNPNNVMVSDDLNRTETWLIDTDNLTSRSNPDPDSDILGFPGYVAPERIIKKAPPSTLADAYSLAVMVFRLLTLCHPLEGNAAELLDGNSAKAAIGRGELAYVADPADESNQLLPLSLSDKLFEVVVSGAMKKLLLKTFSGGRLDPVQRPGTAKWRDVLWHALDNVVDCANNCGLTYYRLSTTCPSCGSKTPPVNLSSVFPEWGESEWDGVGPPARRTFVLSSQNATTVEGRHLWGSYDSKDPLLTFKPAKHGFALDVSDLVTAKDAQGRLIDSIPHPKLRKEYRIHVSSSDRPTRILRITALEVQ